MHELDAWKYWNLQGTIGNDLLKKAAQVLNAYPKANKTRKRECIALAVSLIKAKCHEDGIQWAEMALSEQRFIGTMEEMPAITRRPPPEVPKDPKKEEKKEESKAEPVDPKQLEREFKKAELAKKVAELQDELNKIEGS